MKTNYRSKIIGLLFLVGGICFLAEQLGFWDISIFFPGWWTIFLILPALFSMIENGLQFSNICLMAIGAYFLLDANEWISFQLSLGMIVALFCIFIGFRLIFGNQGYGKNRKVDDKNCATIHSNVVFGNRRLKGNGVIDSLDAQCLFGTQYIDLTAADLRNVQYVTLQATLGTIDLLVGTDMNYVVKKDNTLGSCNIQDEPLGKYDLYVDVTCVLGTINLRKKKTAEYQEGSFKEK